MNKLSHKLKSLTTPEDKKEKKATLDKNQKKELFKKFTETIVPKLEETAKKNLKSYQVPVDNWEISDKIAEWCEKNDLKFLASARKVDTLKSFKNKDLKSSEIRLMMISW
jgi:GH35 family endo-1,4-beta-xylanase